jgi:hypothetical protein
MTLDPPRLKKISRKNVSEKPKSSVLTRRPRILRGKAFDRPGHPYRVFGWNGQKWSKKGSKKGQNHSALVWDNLFGANVTSIYITIWPGSKPPKSRFLTPFWTPFLPLLTTFDQIGGYWTKPPTGLYSIFVFLQVYAASERPWIKVSKKGSKKGYPWLDPPKSAVLPNAKV